MNISVVVTTYNGKKFIKEQLDSISNQTRKPDEVIILDDCSHDGTGEYVKYYIEDKRLNNWKLIINKKTVGWKKNFINGFHKAKGSLIFPSDQDDVWDIRKIEKMSIIMKNKKNIMLLVSNYTPFYEGRSFRRLSGKVIKNMKFDNSVSKIIFDKNFLSVSRPGCSFCFRNDLLVVLDKLWFEEASHDSALWRSALLLDGLFIYNSATMSYRRHERNITNNRIINPLTKIEETSKFLKTINNMQGLLDYSKIKNRDCKRFFINEVKEYYELKQELYTTGNIFTWCRLIAKYRSYYLSVCSGLGDLYILLLRILNNNNNNIKKFFFYNRKV